MFPCSLPAPFLNGHGYGLPFSRRSWPTFGDSSSGCSQIGWLAQSHPHCPLLYLGCSLQNPRLHPSSPSQCAVDKFSRLQLQFLFQSRAREDKAHVLRDVNLRTVRKFPALFFFSFNRACPAIRSPITQPRLSARRGPTNPFQYMHILDYGGGVLLNMQVGKEECRLLDACFSTRISARPRSRAYSRNLSCDHRSFGPAC